MSVPRIKPGSQKLHVVVLLGALRDALAISAHFHGSENHPTPSQLSWFHRVLFFSTRSVGGGLGQIIHFVPQPPKPRRPSKVWSCSRSSPGWGSSAPVMMHQRFFGGRMHRIWAHELVERIVCLLFPSKFLFCCSLLSLSWLYKPSVVAKRPLNLQGPRFDKLTSGKTTSSTITRRVRGVAGVAYSNSTFVPCFGKDSPLKRNSWSILVGSFIRRPALPRKVDAMYGMGIPRCAMNMPWISCGNCPLARLAFCKGVRTTQISMRQVWTVYRYSSQSFEAPAELHTQLILGSETYQNLLLAL